MYEPSIRSNIVTRRTYQRPLDDQGKTFETWEQTVCRVLSHQRWLWERAIGRKLNRDEESELSDLGHILQQRIATVAGRTLWLGGTEVSKRREASQFNCSFIQVETVHDVVDAFWLLLQGCGVGFEPVVGTLNGFARPVETEIWRSKKRKGDPKGCPHNQTEFLWSGGHRVYKLIIGDSAEAWAKALGKLMALKTPVDRIVLDFRQIRAAGERLKGYGWISSGDETVSRAFEAICDLMSKRAGSLLSRMDILDIMNWMGTTLSSRRSAEIANMPYSSPEWEEFALAKKDFWVHGNHHRQQSNNSLVFYEKPTRRQLEDIFEKMMEAGGSEPGFINGETALKRAPWFKGVNPFSEILLCKICFCNLVTPDWGKLVHMHHDAAERVIFLIARANYRQTCVDLDDGILQRTWHELNQFLRLCGVGAAGIVKLLDNIQSRESQEIVLRQFREAAQSGAFSMADQLGLPRPKAVTTVKPDGTAGKMMDTTEGIHRPLGRYIFNNVTFSKHDPIVSAVKKAGYDVWEKPFEPESVLVRFPVAYEDVEFDISDGKYVNLESAVDQLERYKLVMDNYVDHNVSITVSYDPSEVSEIIDWILDNWESYVAVSFIYRNDPSKTAADLGYPYLPQEVVTKEEYDNYVARLSPVDLDGTDVMDDPDDDCSTGACPIR